MSSEKLFSEQTIKQAQPSPSTSNPLAKAATIPSELILQIFKYVTSTTDLKSCILVCKSWCRCGVELLWHKPVLNVNASFFKLLWTLSRPTQTFQYSLLIR
ncbi:11931_t:CDS:1, partial [Acaulospora morrowiae]